MDEIGDFYARHEGEVLSFFLRRTREPETAADLAAETFAEVVAQTRRGTEVREPRAWLYTLARGKLADYQRRGYVAERARRRIGLERLEWTEDELERVLAAGSGADLEQALDALPPEQRASVIGRVVEEREYADLAQAQQTSEAVVRQRVHRGLARLRSLLKEGAR
jgi:RNA polymerase sigma-70 factor (ECF subfamily)